MSQATVPSPSPSHIQRHSRLRRLFVFVWKYFVATVCCTGPVVSVLVVGWTQRLMQRRTLVYWHAQSETSVHDIDFAHFAAADPQTAVHLRWPNWVWHPHNQTRRSWRGWMQTGFASLWLNTTHGIAASFNTWVLTLPGCVLWLFAWYAGWQNSFSKGYEHAQVGSLTGLLGVALFIAAMFYVPLAQARQASTGRWRSFYEFSLIWTLVRSRWWACIKLALLYTVFGLVSMALKMAPIGFDRSPEYAALSDSQAFERLEVYFFWAGAIVFAAYVAVRLVAAQIYADSLLTAIQQGVIPAERLAESERAVLDRLDLLHVQPSPPRHVVVRAVGGVSRLAMQIGAGMVLALVWFVFVAAIFVSEFFNYHPLVGWLNQPLIQLPWFRYIPPGLG